MRAAVVDAGSNTVRLVVTDARDGVPLPVHTAKWRLRLAERTDPDGRLGAAATEKLAAAVGAAAATAARWGAPDPPAFATAVIRQAPDRAEVLRAVQERTGVRLRLLPGELEAELTFLGVRRWMGWRAGPLALFDIGGGSLEVAFGRGRTPEFAASLPLGAGRLTTDRLAACDPPSDDELRALRRHVRHTLRDASARIRWERPQTTVATSRTFQQLARLCGAPPGRKGLFVERALHRTDLRRAVDRLAALPVAARAALPGISAPRARQSLAGAVVAHSVMKLSGVRMVTVCPWALREGILLRCLEDGTDWWQDAPSRPHLASIPSTAVPSSDQAT
ncbi:Ppx/GppA family phosphatase [Streptomyces sp. 4F14]|uniref:Ppx/GppA phosphatase family protein n=1 Tax=Streptomyces sp. 4F14 TaxID=3394380 RepID=UPI003A8AFE75